MAPTISPPRALTFYGLDHCWWRGEFVRVLGWRTINGQAMAVIRQTDKEFNGIALVPEEELWQQRSHES